jgi:hypothetical protein
MAKTLKLYPNKKTVKVFKYRIQEIIDNELPKSISKLSTLEKLLLDEHGISQNEFYRDRTALVKSEFSIPGDRLMVYAKLFDCSIEELMNRTIKVKPLIQSRIKTPLK